MQRLLMTGALVALMIVPLAQGQAQETEFTPAQLKQIRKMFEEWSKQQEMEEMEDAGMPAGDMPAAGAPPAPPSQGRDTPTMGDTTKAQPRYGVDFSGGSGLQGGRTIYARPFVKAPKTIIGGYIDFSLTRCQGGARDCRATLEFDQERFVPFFYSQVTDRLSVAAELEIEHGGPQSNQSDGDVKMEFATIDYRFSDWFNLRGGIILVPMGRFNLVHDSPMNDLPLRPMVSRSILPSTFAESGLGFFGTVYPTQLSKIDYEFYVTNGFDGRNGQLRESNGTRGSRGSLSRDRNENKAIVSRISVSPVLGVEVAGSVHHGQWNDESSVYNGEEHNLTLVAIDGNLQRGAFEIQGEAAWANIGGSGLYATEEGTVSVQNPDDSMRRQIFQAADEAYVVPESMFGYYVQLNYHFMPDALTRTFPSYFGQDSTFTGIVRWGEADTNTDSDFNPNDEERLTLGINFRPIEDSVIKFAYTFNQIGPILRRSGGAYSPGRSANGFQFNLSTYF